METKDLTIKADELGNTTSPLAVPEQQKVESASFVNPIDQFTQPTKQEQQAVEQSTQKVQQAEESLFDQLFQAPTQEQLTLEAKQDPKYLELEAENTRLTNLQLATKQKFDRELQAITNESGLTSAQRQARLNDVQRKQNFEMADIAVQRFVANNLFENAKSAIETKVNAQFSNQKQNIDNLKFILERYDGQKKDALAKVVAKEERAYEKALSDTKQLEELKLTAMSNASLAGAGQSAIAQINSAKTLDEFLAGNGTRFLADPVARAQLTKLNMEIATERKRQEAINNGEVILSKEDKDTVMKLQDDYDKQSGEFIKQTDAYNRIIASAEDPSPAGDLALIFNYMKVLDPGSTVREGEFANAQEAASYANRVYGAGIKLGTGKRLTDTQRADFVDRATRLYSTGYEQQKSLDSQFSKRAQQLSVPADYVIRDLASVSFNGTEAVKESITSQEERNSIPVAEGLDAIIQGALPNTGNTYIDFSFGN